MIQCEGQGAVPAPGGVEDVEALLRCLCLRMPRGRQSSMQGRGRRWLPLLVRALRRLYGQRPDFDHWVSDIVLGAASVAAQRGPALLELDAARERAPGWFLAPGRLAYSAYVDRFAGTLRGVEARIGHLKALGVDYLHLLPFLRARAGENDGGFAVASFESIEPRLGTLADLERLCASLRAAGISLCSDFVLNHVADDHPWASAAKQGVPGYRERFLVFEDEATPRHYERTLRQVFPQSAPGNFSHVPELGGWVWTTFYPYQWDLNYANPAVFRDMLVALLRLANHGVEIFRLDSAPFLWKRLGTDCQNLPEVHWILRALRAAVALFAPGVLLKAEAIVTTGQLARYIGLDDDPSPQCHLAYHSSLMAASWLALTEGSGRIVERVLAATPPTSRLAGWVTYTRCHDDIGWNVLRPELSDEPDGGEARLRRAAGRLCGLEDGRRARGQPFQTGGQSGVHGTNGMLADLVALREAHSGRLDPLGLRRMLLLTGLSMTSGAVPLVYMGDELGLTNTDWSEATARPGQDGRELHRPWMSETALARRCEPGTLEHRVFEGIRHLAAVRARTASLAGDVRLRIRPSPVEALLVFERGEAFVFLGNFCGEAVALDPAWALLDAAHEWADALTGAPIAPDGVIDAWSQCWAVPRARTDGQA